MPFIEYIRKKMPFMEDLKEKFDKRELKHRVRFVILLVLNFGNVLSDWLVFGNVAVVEEGLVIGPNTYIKKGLLIFTTIGSFTVFPEVCLDWKEIIMDEERDLFEGLRAAIIICTDLPLMTINIFSISDCKEDNTYFQMAKAIVMVIIAFIRFMISFVKVKCEKDRGTRKRKMLGLLCRKQVVTAQFMLAVVLLMASSLEPHAIWKVEHDDSEFFTNVSIYFSHPYLDCETCYKAGDKNLIRLLSIYDLKNSMTDQTVNIHYDSNHTNFLVQISGESDQCFKKKTYGVATNCSSDEPPYAGQFAFSFHYVKPSSQSLPYGDITYNMRIANNTHCEAPDFPVVNDMTAHIRDPSSVFLRYYRSYITDNSSLIHLSSTYFEFYRLSDLNEDIWGERNGGCVRFGSHAPHRDERLGVKCL